MPDSPSLQRKSRANAKLDASVVADLAFFTGPNRTKKHKAAIHLAEGKLTQRQIAAELNMSRATLNEWKSEPEFQAVQAVYEEEVIAEALQFAIADKTERVRGLDELNRRYWEIIDTRAETYAQMADTPEESARQVFGSDTVPWAATGMMLRQPKIAASGKTVVEWAFDKPLDAAIKETYREAAAELGQRTEKHEHTGPDGSSLVIQFVEREDGPK